MRDRVLRIWVAGIVSVTAAISVSAHHAFASEFDSKRPVRLVGTVKRMEFSNPHSWLYLEVVTNDGPVQEWAIEGAAPNALIRRGWNRNSLAPGIVVTVRGFQARDGSFHAAGLDVTLKDGSKLFVGSDSGGAPKLDAAPQ
jgi:hypothetical protein